MFGSVTSPGNNPSALTVGAVDMHATARRSDDTVAKYSSKGPTLYDLVIKPDLVAPGSRLVSAEAAGSICRWRSRSGTRRGSAGMPTWHCRERAWRRAWRVVRWRCCWRRSRTVSRVRQSHPSADKFSRV